LGAGAAGTSGADDAPRLTISAHRALSRVGSIHISNFCGLD
jgi:hypothetical protein